MTQTLYQGVSHAAWGYFFLYFDVNLGPLNVLPDWAAYLLFLSAIGKLRGEQRDFLLLRPLGIALAAWNGADWLLSWAGRSVDGLFLPLDLLIAVAGIYFHFQFLTDCAELASVHQPPEAGVDQRIRQWRTVQTVLLTLTTCLLYCLLYTSCSVLTAMTLRQLRTSRLRISGDTRRSMMRGIIPTFT